MGVEISNGSAMSSPEWVRVNPRGVVRVGTGPGHEVSAIVTSTRTTAPIVTSTRHRLARALAPRRGRRRRSWPCPVCWYGRRETGESCMTMVDAPLPQRVR